MPDPLAEAQQKVESAKADLAAAQAAGNEGTIRSQESYLKIQQQNLETVQYGPGGKIGAANELAGRYNNAVAQGDPASTSIAAQLYAQFGISPYPLGIRMSNQNFAYEANRAQTIGPDLAAIERDLGRGTFELQHPLVGLQGQDTGTHVEPGQGGGAPPGSMGYVPPPGTADIPYPGEIDPGNQTSLKLQAEADKAAGIKGYGPGTYSNRFSNDALNRAIAEATPNAVPGMGPGSAYSNDAPYGSIEWFNKEIAARNLEAKTNGDYTSLTGPARNSAFMPFGERAQQEIPDISHIFKDANKLEIYVNRYNDQGVVIGEQLIGGAGLGWKESGMFSFGRAQTPVVYTQYNQSQFAVSVPGTTGKVSASDVLANPNMFSRLGAEAYGGVVQPLDWRKGVVPDIWVSPEVGFFPGTQIGVYPGNPFNLSNAGAVRIPQATTQPEGNQAIVGVGEGAPIVPGSQQENPGGSQIGIGDSLLKNLIPATVIWAYPPALIFTNQGFTGLLAAGTDTVTGIIGWTPGKDLFKAMGWSGKTPGYNQYISDRAAIEQRSADFSASRNLAQERSTLESLAVGNVTKGQWSGTQTGFEDFIAKTNSYNGGVGQANQILIDFDALQRKGLESGALIVPREGTGAGQFVPNPDAQQPYGEWSRQKQAATKEVQGLMGFNAGQLEAYGGVIAAKPTGLGQWLENRIYGFNKELWVGDVGKPVEGAVAALEITAGIGAIGAGTSAIAAGSSRFAPVASSIITASEHPAVGYGIFSAIAVDSAYKETEGFSRGYEGNWAGITKVAAGFTSMALPFIAIGGYRAIGAGRGIVQNELAIRSMSVPDQRVIGAIRSLAKDVRGINSPTLKAPVFEDVKYIGEEGKGVGELIRAEKGHNLYGGIVMQTQLLEVPRTTADVDIAVTREPATVSSEWAAKMGGPFEAQGSLIVRTDVVGRQPHAVDIHNPNLITGEPGSGSVTPGIIDRTIRPNELKKIEGYSVDPLWQQTRNKLAEMAGRLTTEGKWEIFPEEHRYVKDIGDGMYLTDTHVSTLKSEMVEQNPISEWFTGRKASRMEGNLDLLRGDPRIQKAIFEYNQRFGVADIVVQGEQIPSPIAQSRFTPGIIAGMGGLSLASFGSAQYSNMPDIASRSPFAATGSASMVGGTPPTSSGSVFGPDPFHGSARVVSTGGSLSPSAITNSLIAPSVAPAQASLGGSLVPYQSGLGYPTTEPSQTLGGSLSPYISSVILPFSSPGGSPVSPASSGIFSPSGITSPPSSPFTASLPGSPTPPSSPYLGGGPPGYPWNPRSPGIPIILPWPSNEGYNQRQKRKPHNFWELFPIGLDITSFGTSRPQYRKHANYTAQITGLPGRTPRPVRAPRQHFVMSGGWPGMPTIPGKIPQGLSFNNPDEEKKKRKRRRR